MGCRNYLFIDCCCWLLIKFFHFYVVPAATNNNNITNEKFYSHLGNLKLPMKYFLTLLLSPKYRPFMFCVWLCCRRGPFNGRDFAWTFFILKYQFHLQTFMRRFSWIEQTTCHLQILSCVFQPKNCWNKLMKEKRVFKYVH